MRFLYFTVISSSLLLPRSKLDTAHSQLETSNLPPNYLWNKNQLKHQGRPGTQSWVWKAWIFCSHSSFWHQPSFLFHPPLPKIYIWMFEKYHSNLNSTEAVYITVQHLDVFMMCCCFFTFSAELGKMSENRLHHLNTSMGRSLAEMRVSERPHAGETLFCSQTAPPAALQPKILRSARHKLQPPQCHTTERQNLISIPSPDSSPNDP